MCVFGSVARGTSGLNSDVDVVFEMKKPDMLYLGHIKQGLENALGCPVDVINYREEMNSFLWERIAQEAVYV
ncbi:nucleotidyltransferase domain-containing protein [Desulfopila sp. IMCC35008]|uniref:nucleotidyltransferase family protein n=1 Tax=Desulfopila sp. IMCC35008 TaxID=2653858 RepID=UPI0013D81D28